MVNLGYTFSYHMLISKVFLEVRKAFLYTLDAPWIHLQLAVADFYCIFRGWECILDTSWINLLDTPSISDSNCVFSGQEGILDTPFGYIFYVMFQMCF